MTAVAHADFCAAVAPLLDLIGVDAAELLDGPHLTSDGIEYVTCLPVDGVEPIEVGEGEWAVWGWPVTVAVGDPA